MNAKYQQFREKFPKTFLDKPLAALSSFGIGGPADLFYNLDLIEEIDPLITELRTQEIPYVILGGGSNTIFSEKGFRGMVIHLTAKKMAVEPAEEGVVSAEAGALLSQVIQYALKNQLSGMEKLMGLPGTIGGAVRGNAGAFGTEIKDLVTKAVIYCPKAGSQITKPIPNPTNAPQPALKEVPASYFEFDYRHSTIKTNQDIVLKVFLKLKPGNTDEAKKAMLEAQDIVKNRITKQPKGKCSGSFFKNPVTPDYANTQDPSTKVGYLLEQVGAKGLKNGGAEVSLQHANWLLNTANATQQDVITLAKILKQKVKDRFNISITPEVQFIGETGFLPPETFDEP